MKLLTELRNLCLSYHTVWVAYSGGLDSQVLLALCVELRKSHAFNLRAIHVHHGLSRHADEWASHCKRYCHENQIEYIEERVQLNLQAGDSLENVARSARYACFAQHVGKGDILLTAHHQDDQAETLLLQLLRGAGPKGLAAMPDTKSFGNAQLGRPLLNFPRTELLRYAQEHALSWMEDDSNSNSALSRNFLRHKIIPVLKERWPSVQETLARSAQHCAEAQVLLEEFAADFCLQSQGSRIDTLSVSKLLTFSPARQRMILRTWIYQSGYPLPPTAKLETIMRNVLHARWDRRPHVHWQGADLRRHKDDLYIQAPLVAHDVQSSVTWKLGESLELSGIGVLNIKPIANAGLSQSITEVSVRFRQGGEVVRLANRKHHDLRKLFQEWNVLPWQRDRIPLLYHEDKLIAAVGYYIDPDYQAKEAEIGHEVLLTQPYAP